jgi:hypothetical protein
MSKARADAAPVLPRSVEALMQRAFSETDGFRDLGALEGALGRAFYGELGADDRTHGPGALAALVASLQPAVVARRESDRTDPEATPPVVPGDLTRALEARNRTVVPQPLAADDQPTGFGDRPAFRAATRPDASSLTSEHAPRRAAGPPPPSTGTGAPHSPPLYVPVPRPPMPIAARLFWFALGFIAAILLVTAHRIFSIPVPPAADPARPGAPAGR